MRQMLESLTEPLTFMCSDGTFVGSISTIVQLGPNTHWREQFLAFDILSSRQVLGCGKDYPILLKSDLQSNLTPRPGGSLVYGGPETSLALPFLGFSANRARLLTLPRANHSLCSHCVCSHLWVPVWWNWNSPLTGSPKVPPQGPNWPTHWSLQAKALGAVALAQRRNPENRLSQWVVWSCTPKTPHSTKRYLWMK